MKGEFSSKDARQLTGATQRQLDYWEQAGLIKASVRSQPGKGRARSFSYSDIIELRVVVELRRAGLSLQRIRKALMALETHHRDPRAWAKGKLITDGEDIFVTTSDREVLKSVFKTGQLAFSVVLLGDIVRDAGKALKLHTDQATKEAV